MRNSRISAGAAALALACVLGAPACRFLPGSKDSGSTTTPTGPSAPTVNMDAFAGTWASAAASTPATGCGNVKYTVTPVSATSANVVFAATCGGNISVNGGGAGTLSGDALSWSANGVVSQGGLNCPFTFPNGKATPDATTGTIAIAYSGTVCGIPVSGTETVKK